MLDYNTIKNMTQEEYKQIKPMLSTHSDSDHEGITQAKKLGLVPGAKVRILFDICDDAIITEFRTRVGGLYCGKRYPVNVLRADGLTFEYQLDQLELK